MGELILCNSRLAANSYYLEDASLNIYSLEELSYYVYNNAYRINEGFINNSLIRWIEKEVGDKKLALELSEFVSGEANLNVIVGHLLRSNGYLSRTEIKHCLEIISSFEGKSEAESRKIRADYLLKEGKLADAVFSYETILSRNYEMSDELYGNVLHNLGCALSGMFFFKRAALNFEKAYRLNRNEDSLDNLLYACLFAEDEELFSLMVDRYQVLPEDIDRIRHSYKGYLYSRQTEDFSEEISRKLANAKDEVEKGFIFEEYLDNFKSDYRRLRTY